MFYLTTNVDSSLLQLWLYVHSQPTIFMNYILNS